jgi:hypothetical protein
VHVIAIVGIVRTNPVKTVKFLLDCVDEVFASDDCIWNLSELSTRVSVDVNV